MVLSAPGSPSSSWTTKFEWSMAYFLLDFYHKSSSLKLSAAVLRVMLMYLFLLLRWSPIVRAEIGTDGYQRLSASSWGRGLAALCKYFWSQQVANNVIFSFRNFLLCQNIHHTGYFDVLSGRLFLVSMHLKSPGISSCAFFRTAN